MSKLKGKVIAVDTQTGQGKNGQWNRLSVVVETSSKYNNTVPVGFFNPEFKTPSVGQEVEIDYYLGGRQGNNGGYFATVDGSQLMIVGGNQISQPKHPMVSQSFDDMPEDDLPF